jgi:hypothetical protein
MHRPIHRLIVIAALALSGFAVTPPANLTYLASVVGPGPLSAQTTVLATVVGPGPLILIR